MSISAETQNQIQQCLDRLSEVAKTPEERVEAIYMAWDGYKREQELKNHKRLQDLSTEVLTAGYEIWRDEGIKLIESAMVEASSVAQIAWKRILGWPKPNEFIVSESASRSEIYKRQHDSYYKDPEFIKPTISGVKQINMMGYLATTTSLMVFPASMANIKSVSLWQDLTDGLPSSIPLVFELFETCARFAANGNCEARFIISGLRKLSCAELYFSDIVTVESKLGQLKVTSRDGRGFQLRADSEVIGLVRESIRASKGIAQEVRPTPSSTSD